MSTSLALAAFCQDPVPAVRMVLHASVEQEVMTYCNERDNLT